MLGEEGVMRVFYDNFSIIRHFYPKIVIFYAHYLYEFLCIFNVKFGPYVCSFGAILLVMTKLDYVHHYVPKQSSYQEYLRLKAKVEVLQRAQR